MNIRNDVNNKISGFAHDLIYEFHCYDTLKLTHRHRSSKLESKNQFEHRYGFGNCSWFISSKNLFINNVLFAKAKYKLFNSYIYIYIYILQTLVFSHEFEFWNLEQSSFNSKLKFYLAQMQKWFLSQNLNMRFQKSFRKSYFPCMYLRKPFSYLDNAYCSCHVMIIKLSL